MLGPRIPTALDSLGATGGQGGQHTQGSGRLAGLVRSSALAVGRTPRCPRRAEPDQAGTRSGSMGWQWNGLPSGLEAAWPWRPQVAGRVWLAVGRMGGEAGDGSPQASRWGTSEGYGSTAKRGWAGGVEVGSILKTIVGLMGFPGPLIPVPRLTEGGALYKIENP